LSFGEWVFLCPLAGPDRAQPSTRTLRSAPGYVRKESGVKPSVVVLKFGSSVLHSAAQLPLAIEEIYREWRAGRQVVAVVSAFAGVTDRRFAEARARSSDLHEQAAWVAGGEEESGTQLAAALLANGVSARYLDAREMGLIAQGQPHDSTPVALDTTHLLACLSEHAVLVVPGFVAQDLQGRCVLLGRGGSDLTALFLAQNLDARCCLLKDVDGVYDGDPAVVTNHARRFQRLSWRSALEIGGKIIQPRALQFAQSCGQPFEVACVGATLSTHVDHGPDEFAAVPIHCVSPMRVVLLGLGTVGLGVYAHLTRRPDLFEIVRIVVRDVNKPRRIDDGPISIDVPRSLLSSDIGDAVSEPADLVIETIGGIEPAGHILHAALLRGRAVVTANKALIASRWWEKLAPYAAGEAPLLRFSAAVGGALPVLETISSLAPRGGAVRVRAILNGTCNYILDALERGIDFKSAVVEAQERGFAEADPHDDLVGLDAARKLQLIARAAFGADVPCELHVGGIEAVTPSQISLVCEDGLRLRLVATCERAAGGQVQASVRLCELPESDFLAGTRAEDNRVEILTHDGEVVRLSGKGAGRWPTALSVLGDVHDHVRDRCSAGEDREAAVVSA
jgi:homoserine dehydrogenase